MITEAAVFLRDEVRRYLVEKKEAKPTSVKTDVILGNVATLENEAGLQDKVVLTLVNVEEESTLKNRDCVIRNPSTNGLESVSKPVYLNLYFLFSATLRQAATDEDYVKALQRISAIIELFQTKRAFTVQNSPSFEPKNVKNLELIPELRLHPELYTLTFEQINHLWGSLGGKQSPFVMYKVRLVKIQGFAASEGPLIETIGSEVRERNAALLETLEKTERRE